ncbi:MAG TPA: electron transfer flavoprotein subunit alpha/FixB family protein [Terriglobales bacterium]|nr:electron transfer flavoprotein subunit alpha/FixB family protein [Terriglobales bacterium]
MSAAILVLAEHLKGAMADITFEMLGVGRKIAAAEGRQVHAVLLGTGVTPLAGRLGAADSVLLADEPGLEQPSAEVVVPLLQQLMNQKQAGLVLMGGTNACFGLGAQLSARVKLPFVNFCKDARADGGALVLTSQLFGGKILSDVKLADGRGIVSVYPGAFPAEAGRSEQAPAVEKVTVPPASPKIVFKRYVEPDTSDVDITKQSVLVAVGRGIQSQDNVGLAEELAQSLGGAVCASRPVIDQGWLPLSRQVGKSGMTVKPRLYLAFGISGAPEHWDGMQNSECIISVNTDPKAPIFDGSHYGVVGDAVELIPLLTEKIKAKKG